MIVEIKVQLPSGFELTAGVLQDVPSRTGSKPTATFRYAPAYLAAPGSYNLSPELQLDSSPQDTAVHRQMFMGFEDSGPDRWGRDLLQEDERHRARTEGRGYGRLSTFEELIRVPDNTRQGAIRFFVEGQPAGRDADPGRANLVDWPNLMSAADTIASGQRLDDEMLQQLFRYGSSSPGGARPKVNVIGADGQLQLAKLPHKDDRWDVSFWESAALTMAARAGITVPRHALHKFDDHRSILLIDRFDCRDHSRVGYLSARTLLWIEDHDHDRGSYTQFAERLGQVAGQADLEELFRRVAFTVLVGNADDHMRNHGMLRERDGWKLAPSFDVNPSIGPSFDSTPVRPGSDPQHRDLRELLEMREVFRLTFSQAVTIFKEVEDATRDWSRVALEAGHEPEDVNRFAEAFEGQNREWVKQLQPE